MNEQKTNFDTETARDDSDVILDVRNLDVYLNTYSGRIHAVRDVSFTLKKGETLVVVGESGCGKSMTARAIMQLLPEKISEVGERSQILFNGTDILKMPEKKKETELRGKYISMIFQDPTTFLNPTMTVGEQIAESLLLHSKMKKKEAMEQALSLPGQKNSHCQGCCAGPHRGSGVEDGRKGHDGQGDVGDVIEKGLDIYVLYLLLNQGQRKNTDQVGHACHHKNIQVHIMIHVHFPPLQGTDKRQHLPR